MSQEQLAKALCVSFSTINRWENRKTVPSNLAQKTFFDFCEGNFIEIPAELKNEKTKEPLNKAEPASQELDAIELNEEEKSFNQSFPK